MSLKFKGILKKNRLGKDWKKSCLRNCLQFTKFTSAGTVGYNLLMILSGSIKEEKVLPRKIRTESNRFGWFEFNNEFSLIDQEYWLPKKRNIKMKIDRTALNRSRAKMPFAPGAGSSPPAMFDNLSGTGQIFITFHHYKINTGIPDDFFSSKEKK